MIILWIYVAGCVLFAMLGAYAMGLVNIHLHKRHEDSYKKRHTYDEYEYSITDMHEAMVGWSFLTIIIVGLWPILIFPVLCYLLGRKRGVSLKEARKQAEVAQAELQKIIDEEFPQNAFRS